MQKILSNITKTYFQYNDIKLRTYIEIATTGNLRLLIKRGYPTEIELLKAWENLVKENAKANNDHTYSAYESNLKRYGKLLADYELVRLSLMKLILVVDDECLLYLKSKGFKINTETATGYVDSINLALHRSNSYLTRIKMKLNELNEMKADQDKTQPKSIEEILGSLSSTLGFNIPEDVTLARFNEYKKVAKKKQEPKRKQKV